MTIGSTPTAPTSLQETTKRGSAINGDRFELRHPSLTLDGPFTTFIDVAFRGVTHQVLAAADRNAFDHAYPTGEFTVAGYPGMILETLDAIDAQVSHRYQALVTTPHGVLSTHSYDSAGSLLALVGALQPSDGPLGIMLHPDHECEYVAAPRVALTVDFGVLEITPLTTEVIERLPDWKGTEVDGGELYGGRFTDESPYLTLVTDSCRVLALPGAGVDEDRLAASLSGLHARWVT